MRLIKEVFFSFIGTQKRRFPEKLFWGRVLKIGGDNIPDFELSSSFENEWLLSKYQFDISKEFNNKLISDFKQLKAQFVFDLKYSGGLRVFRGIIMEELTHFLIRYRPDNNINMD